MRSDDERDGRALIAALDLAPHPEGGWYRETWRAAAPDGERAAETFSPPIYSTREAWAAFGAAHGRA